MSDVLNRDRAEAADNWFKKGLLDFDQLVEKMAQEGDFAQFEDPKRGVVLAFLFAGCKKIVKTNDLDEDGLSSFIAAASRDRGGSPAAEDWFQALEDLQKPEYDEPTIKKQLYETTRRTGIAKKVHLSRDKMGVFLELAVCWAIRLLLLKTRETATPKAGSLAAVIKTGEWT